MKKFLLLIVGVLFALSANAWTFYADISGTDWGDEAPYLYLGKVDSDKDHYYTRVQGTKVEGTTSIYKFTAAWNGLTRIMFSKTWKEVKDDKGNENLLLSDQFSYNDEFIGALTDNNSDHNWKIVDNSLYVLGKGDNRCVRKNGFVTSTSTVKIVFGTDNWNTKTELELKNQGNGTYTLAQSSTIAANTEFKVIIDGNWTGADANPQEVYKDTEYGLSLIGNGNNLKVKEDIANPTIIFDANNWTIKFQTTTTPTPDPTAYTIYFDAARSSWSKVELTGAEATASVAENGLNKFEFTKTGDVYFSNGEGTELGFAETPLATGHVYYVEDSKLKDGGEYASYKPLAQWEIRLSGKFCGWSTPGADDTTAPLFTYQGGTTFILYLNNTLKSGSEEGGFKVYDVTGNSDWGTGYGTTKGNQIELGTRYQLEKSNESGTNVYNKYEIVRPLLTLDVSTWTLTITKPELEFTYAIHGTIIEGNEKDKWLTFTMNKMEGSNYWCYEGYLRAGDFGIIKIDTTTGNQYKEGTDDTIGWIYNETGTDFTIGTSDSWYKAATKKDASGGHNWTLSSDFDGTKLYTIMFNAAPYDAETNPTGMHILVSTVAPSGVEDINVDEDAPVEYFNLQGQRVNGELTPGIYIRRQGSTVTKVRF